MKFVPARQRLENLFYPAVPDTWALILRIGLGLQIVLYSISSRPDWSNFFSLETGTFVRRDLAEAVLSISSPLIPRLGWLVTLGESIGLHESTVVWLVWYGLITSGACLIVGFLSRAAATVAWFLYVCTTKSLELLTYGADHFTIIGLFILVLSPMPTHLALDRVIWKTTLQSYRQHLSGFFRRVLQIHLCIIYLSSGLTKCLGKGWWTGESLWRSLTRPPFNFLPSQTVLSWKPVLIPLGIGVCLLETGYAFFIWKKRTRLIWLIGILGMHVAIGIMMKLFLFSLVMIVLNLAAFGAEFICRDRSSEDPTHARVD